MDRGGWHSIDTAPMDGTPLLLFARLRADTAPVRLIGWWGGDRWIELCFTPNEPQGVMAEAWQHLPGFP